MLAPLGNTISVPITQTLVSTQLPNAIALRVPVSDVAPSVSSPEIYNNASGNNVASVKTDNPQVNIIFSNGNIAGNGTAGGNKNFPNIIANAQTAFIAQLASGDTSPEVRGLFAQYEKLLSYANVKYKPSNAGKPSEPVSLFRTLLQMEKENPAIIEIPETKSETEFVPVLDSKPFPDTKPDVIVPAEEAQIDEVFTKEPVSPAAQQNVESDRPL